MHRPEDYQSYFDSRELEMLMFSKLLSCQDGSFAEVRAAQEQALQYNKEYEAKHIGVSLTYMYDKLAGSATIWPTHVLYQSRSAGRRRRV
jgi:hypothetical protein